MNLDIGKKIRLLRLSKGMTQEQLAEKLSVTPQTVSKWENCVTTPDIGLLPQLSVDNLIDDGRAEEAEYILAKLRRTDDTCRTLWYEAQIHWLRGEVQQAEDALYKMTQQYPEDWLAWSYKGDLYARMGHYDKADECWEHSHSLQPCPRLIDDLLCLAQTAIIRKDYGRAAELYRRTIKVLETDYTATEGDMITQFRSLAEMYDSFGG